MFVVCHPLPWWNHRLYNQPVVDSVAVNNGTSVWVQPSAYSPSWNSRLYNQPVIDAQPILPAGTSVWYQQSTMWPQQWTSRLFNQAPGADQPQQQTDGTVSWYLPIIWRTPWSIIIGSAGSEQVQAQPADGTAIWTQPLTFAGFQAFWSSLYQNRLYSQSSDQIVVQPNDATSMTIFRVRHSARRF